MAWTRERWERVKTVEVSGQHRCAVLETGDLDASAYWGQGVRSQALSEWSEPLVFTHSIASQ
jgi:hypothetical protein